MHMRYRFIRIGMDNVDSYWGGCTTHFGYLVIKKILRFGGLLVDYPKLIRLNPDIPWKTRGNGCVCIDAMIPRSKVALFVKWLGTFLLDYMDKVDGYSVKNQPVVVVINGDLMDDEDYQLLNTFYLETLHSIVSVNKALETLEALKDKIITVYSPYGLRGLIGALSALGNIITKDYTYELLIYRDLDIRGRNRLKMPDRNIVNILVEDEDTFAHMDPENNKILITPAGPDPVVAGIRGNKLSKVFSFFKKIRGYINYSGWVVFVTNQGTNENLFISRNISGYYRQILCELTLFTKLRLKGGHLSIRGESNGEYFVINFYYESGRVRNIVDRVLNNVELKTIIGGGIKPNKKDSLIDKVINPQIMIMPKHIIDYEVYRNPICPKCKVTLKSSGVGDLYKCKKCGYRIYNVENKIHKNMIIPNILLPPYRSILHISKPLKRMGREKRYRYYGIKKMRWIY